MKRALLALVACLVLLALVGYAVFRYKTRDIELDSAKVEALAARLLPGASPVNGSHGVAAMEKGKLKVAVFAPSLRKAKPQRLEGAELRFVVVGVENPPDGEAFEQLQALVAEVRAEQQEQGIETVEKAPTVVSLGGRPHPALRMTQQIGSGGPLVEEYLTMLKGEGEGALLLVTGPKSSFNKKDMQTFLDRLKLPPPRPPIEHRPGKPPGDGKPPAWKHRGPGGHGNLPPRRPHRPGESPGGPDLLPRRP